MSHPVPTREYGEHPDEPQYREYMRTHGYRQGHKKTIGSHVRKIASKTQALKKMMAELGGRYG